MHSAVPPEFSAQSQHSDRRVTVPFRIGLEANRVRPICSEGKCATRRLCAHHSERALSGITGLQVGGLHHSILHYSITHLFPFCKSFFQKKNKLFAFFEKIYGFAGRTPLAYTKPAYIFWSYCYIDSKGVL